MVALVFVPPKNGSFSYCNTQTCWFWLLCRTYATQIHKSKTKKTRRKPKTPKQTKKNKETKKNNETQKNKETKKTNPLEETLGHNISPKTLVFLVSLVFLVFFEVFFCFFLSPVADETFRV